MDTPVTLSNLRAGRPLSYLDERGLREYDLVLSFTGGAALVDKHTGYLDLFRDTNLWYPARDERRGVTVHDPAAFMAAVADAKRTLQPHPSRHRLMTLGTHAMMDVTHAYGSLPTRNERDVQFEGTARLNAAASQKPHGPNGVTNLITNKACFACTIGCGRVAHIDPEHFSVKGKPRYHGASGGLEYENVFALGAMVGVDDLDAVTFANFVCNEDGMDTISFGGALAAAMELYEEGAIGKEQTGGVDLSFGSAEGLVAMAELTARGEGFGAADDALPPSIFIVGDRKQSIYGFRDADVAVVDEAAEFIRSLRPDGQHNDGHNDGHDDGHVDRDRSMRPNGDRSTHAHDRRYVAAGRHAQRRRRNDRGMSLRHVQRAGRKLPGHLRGPAAGLEAPVAVEQLFRLAAARDLADRETPHHEPGRRQCFSDGIPQTAGRVVILNGDDHPARGSRARRSTGPSSSTAASASTAPGTSTPGSTSAPASGSASRCTRRSAATSAACAPRAWATAARSTSRRATGGCSSSATSTPSPSRSRRGSRRSRNRAASTSRTCGRRRGASRSRPAT